MKLTRRKFIKLSAMAVMLGAISDISVIEPYRIVISRYDVPLRRLPPELDGLKIAQLSDLHRSRIVPDALIRKAVRMSNALSPDIAVFTGDFVSRNSGNAEPCAEMLSEIRTRYGSFAVIGNHDCWAGSEKVQKSLRDHGITVLVNQNTRPIPGLTILGLDDHWIGHPDQEKTWKGANPDDAHVFLCHNPMALRKMKGRDCLMLAGHTHGGQVIIPFIPRNRLPGLKGWRYISGWYNEGNVDMYINRGIGMIFPPIRFLCPPEITLFTLRSQTAS